MLCSQFLHKNVPSRIEHVYVSDKPQWTIGKARITKISSVRSLRLDPNGRMNDKTKLIEVISLVDKYRTQITSLSLCGSFGAHFIDLLKLLDASIVENLDIPYLAAIVAFESVFPGGLPRLQRLNTAPASFVFEFLASSKSLFSSLTHLTISGGSVVAGKTLLALKSLNKVGEAFPDLIVNIVFDDRTLLLKWICGGEFPETDVNPQTRIKHANLFIHGEPFWICAMANTQIKPSLQRVASILQRWYPSSEETLENLGCAIRFIILHQGVVLELYNLSELIEFFQDQIDLVVAKNDGREVTSGAIFAVAALVVLQQLPGAPPATSNILLQLQDLVDKMEMTFYHRSRPIDLDACWLDRSKPFNPMPHLKRYLDVNHFL